METNRSGPPPFQNELLDHFVQLEQKVNVLKSWRATALAIPLHVPAMRCFVGGLIVLFLSVGIFFSYRDGASTFLYIMIAVIIFFWFAVFRQKTMHEYVLTNKGCFTRDRIHDPLGVWNNSAAMGVFLLAFSVAAAIVTFFFLPLAALAPLVLGIMAAQSMRAVRNPYSYGSIEWEKVDHIIVDRHMQAIEISSKKADIWGFQIYCPKGRLKETLDFVQSQLPKPLPVWTRLIIPGGYSIAHKQTLLDEEQIQAL